MNSLLFAISFLSRIPIPYREYTELDIKKSIYYFPLVGLMIGIILYVVVLALETHLPSPMISLILVALWALITGCFHLDGLADSADALFSSRTRERMLEIMKDSHIGVMGVLALLFVISFKVTGLYYLMNNHVLEAIIFIPMLSRLQVIYLLGKNEYIRKQGLGELLWTYPEQKSYVYFVLVLLVGSILFSFHFVLIVFFTWFFACLYANYCKKQLGGATGDTIGASVELQEVFLVILIIMLY